MKTALILVALLGLASASVLPARKRIQDKGVLMPHLMPASKGTGRIVGGQMVDDHADFKYAVSLTFNNAGGSPSYYCTGSILATDWVVTAGHCGGGGGASVDIHAGENLHDGPNAQTVRASTFIVHEDYNPFFLYNDISLIQLESEQLVFDAMTGSIPLSTRDPQSGDLMKAAGWGKTHDSDFTIPDYLYYVENLPAMTEEECENTYGSLENSFCTDSTGGVGICSGDSGGPLVNENEELAGVNSFVHVDGCESGQPHGYANVFRLTDWILGNTGGLP